MNRIFIAATTSLALLFGAPASAQSASPTPPQELTGIAHLQLSALLSPESSALTVPGMPNAKRWIHNMIDKALPEVSVGWASRSFDASAHMDEIECISSPDSFQAEDHGDSWLYHDDRLYACTWGLEGFLMVLRVSIQETEGTGKWVNTEVLELREPNLQ